MKCNIVNGAATLYFEGELSAYNADNVDKDVKKHKRIV